MAVGALQAVEQMGYEPGKDIQIISAADSYYIALEYIQEGKILATGYGPAAAIGEGVINLVDKIFVQGYDANDMVISTDLDPIAIYSENVDDFYDYPNTQFAKAIVPTYLTIPEYNAAHGN
jgi:ABC-type sugar transport system substrate-binding protein